MASSEMARLEGFLARSAALAPDAIALVYDEQRIAYRELARRARQLA